MTIFDDLFGSFVDDVHLEAERSGEPVNERHLASIRRARALTLQQVEETAVPTSLAPGTKFRVHWRRHTSPIAEHLCHQTIIILKLDCYLLGVVLALSLN